jgi:hypothetical protein
VKILAILALAFATLLPASEQLRSVDEYEATYPGLDFAVHGAFIKCYVNHWKGSETEEIAGTSYKVRMTCKGFWDRFVLYSQDPTRFDYPPFIFSIIPERNVEFEIPFPIWNELLRDALAISTDNPLRKHK